MDVAELAQMLNELIDLKYLAGELQRQPVVANPDGTWRAMTEGETKTTLRLVGEAIGVRVGEDAVTAADGVGPCL